jgi:hypothetical protein
VEDIMEEIIEHPWEYTHMVQIATPKTRVDYGTNEGRQSVIKACGQVFGKLPQIIDKMPTRGGWQVNSHNILLVGGSIMVSILLQRPKRA